jgi:transcriptional regulator with XRE-family HTH domain
MEDGRVGTVIRAVRHRRKLRQLDVAKRAGVSQRTVSDIERGHLVRVSLRALRAVGAVLEVGLPFSPRWRGPELDRLLDAQHATIVEIVVGSLRSNGWQVLVEWSFSEFGERGSVDVIGWHEASRTLLVIEVKTKIVDVQELLATHDRKVRLARRLLLRERGWRAAAVGRVLVVLDGTTNRDVVSRHRQVFEAVLPARTLEVRRWLSAPGTDLAGLWFLRPSTDRTSARSRNSSEDHRAV